GEPRLHGDRRLRWHGHIRAHRSRRRALQRRADAPPRAGEPARRVRDDPADQRGAGGDRRARPRRALISSGAQSMRGKPETIDEYLAPLSGEKRAALEKLRRAIRSVAPGAEECISYNIPAFRLGGRLLVGFGAAANHCAFYPGAHPVKAHSDELKV